MNDKLVYQLSKEDVLKQFNTSEKGLSSTEAQKRLELYGPNQLLEAKKRSLFMKFLDQFKDFMVIVLIAAALIAFLAAIIEGKPEELTEGLLIIAIVVINAILGVAQEAKAEQALESIKRMSNPHTTVLRDGKEIVINVDEVIVGDIVILQAGDYIPADVRILESINLKTDESALTGEPIPVEKTTDAIQKSEVPLGDRTNLAFMGTVVTYGRGLAIVTSTGMNTEIGKIASMLSSTEAESTPLQKNIAKLGKTLALIALIVVAVIFLIQVLRGTFNGGFENIHWVEIFMSSVALAVAAIPEGLPAIITIVLAIGMQNLVKQRAIMRTLPAVETLGSTSIICSDKTGTLTQNVMTITKTYLFESESSVASIAHPEGKLNDLITYGVLCNDTKVQLDENQKYVRIGDPTEIALTDLAIYTKLDPIDILKKYPRVHELPFDSERKLMTTVHIVGDQYVSITKGAPDILISKASHVDQSNGLIPMSDSIMKNFITKNQLFADEALRVLAISYKEYPLTTDIKKLLHDELENNLTLLGLVGMIDPARPEVKDAIVETKRAGITTIMITGDHKNTAIAIAKELGILESSHLAITGKELDAMSDEEFKSKLNQIRVYARVSPENKVRIVTAWKETGLIVAMTGDGVNDAPSIKKADIGIAMGITGTEVAKGAADMILTDDNFSTIVGAVKEGRTILSNIKKAIHFLLSCNIGEIITILLGVTIGIILFPLEPNLQILTAAQILWVNLVTDSFMAIALGLEPKEPDVMNRPPRDNSKSLFADGLGFRIGYQGIFIGFITFLAFYIGYEISGKNVMHAQTITFMVLSLSQLFHAFNVRSEKFSTFKLQPNKYLMIAFFGSLLLQLMTVTIPFVANNIFGVDSVLNWQVMDWVVVLGLSISPLVLVEIIKFVQSLRKQ
ncbi:Calcium-transporting ATPase lmo0841 [Acholeplasma oculi]|uniref:P-type Ca(2+) transporter n=1 Tax=Acholeplasma oculi TaxID=35623 RepID=A0A061AJ16_9MOLU|nr:calcium-translocating P-type ATPase, PMCA-type [Acholeplasma oculi]CDR30987.1 Calcium-transporting p-type ATPase [Acholeplasma oculi]SKC36056.1 Ca2+-transporting ATPase [Acholeplasma oculi]SUT90386.1 Calcium-transporting ATPase lmo0841 [Acholeplasma oculi]